MTGLVTHKSDLISHVLRLGKYYE